MELKLDKLLAVEAKIDRVLAMLEKVELQSNGDMVHAYSPPPSPPSSSPS